MDDAWIGRLESFVSRQLQGDPNACLAIGVLSGGELVYSKGFGYRDFSLTKPVTDRTLFGVGSVTKSITALSVLLLEEEGRLSVEDPVSEYLPEYVLGGSGGVRIKHLLTHTSGIPALGVAETIIEEKVKSDRKRRFRDRSEFVEWVNRGALERVAAPGEKFLYWNEGYTILGEIVGKVSSLGYREFVGRRVLTPLGMSRSGFGVSMLSDDDSIEPYVVDGKRKIRVGFPDHPLLYAAGGLISCVRDLLRYIGVFIADPQPFEKKLLERLVAPHVKCGLPTPFGDEYYGYGWVVNQDFYGHTLVYHSGNIGVSTAYVGFIPEAKIGVALVSNSENIHTAYVGAFALTQLLGIEEESLPFVRYQRLIDTLSGVYENFSGTVKLELRQAGSMLYASFSQEGATQTFPVVLEDGNLSVVVGVECIPIELISALGRVDLLIERNRFHRVS
jgi:CubicO group peptidase (beta-lactamase class C family)